MDLIDTIHGYLSWMTAVIKNQPLKTILGQFEEDINLTRESFTAKSSIAIHLQETEELATSIYCKRFCDLCKKIITHAKLSEELNEIIRGYQQEISITNPTTPDFLPDHLLFSQNKHNNRFSNQSHFFKIHEKPIKKIVTKLKNHEYSPRDFPLRIYCAEFRGKVRWFTANNRSWTALSRANILPIRVIPILPTYELMHNRLSQLSGNPNSIRSEDSDTETTSLKEADSPRLRLRKR